MQLKQIITLAALLGNGILMAQSATEIRQSEVSRVINKLASDDMRGRKVYTPQIDEAAAFIATEFKNAGLQPLIGSSFLQRFSTISATQQGLTASAGNQQLDAKNFVVLTASPEVTITANQDYPVKRITAQDNFFAKAMEYASAGQNAIVLVDTSFAQRFPRLAVLKRNFFKSAATVVFVSGDIDLKNFKLTATHQIKELQLSNVAGLLTGNKRKDEYVIFSAHYDHIGIGQAENGDSIYNGANDDASGTTAVIELAKYYAKKKDNDRSIIFVAFTAEEVGGFGSQYFSQQLDPEKVMAMFNIEMIGTDSKWGKNSAYITGYEKTNMGDILQKNLQGSGFSFHPDPYPDQQLFYRSDNATLARLGVPAHTISTSKMDSEPNYHKASDEVSTLDLENMTRIIKSIAISAQSIVAGKDTPTRVDTSSLR
ncbi:hypothetical protein GCM10027051_08530 [Niabella terrae]